MIISCGISNTIYNALNQRKRVSRLGFSQDDFNQYCHTLNLIAGCDEFVDNFNNYNIDSYKVPKNFKELVVPCRVSLETSLDYEDIRDDVYLNYSPDDFGYEDNINWLKPLQFNGITDAIFGAKRKEPKGDQLIDLQTARSVVSISEVKDRLCSRDNGLVLMTDSPYIPIYSDVIFKKSNKYIYDINVMIEDWIDFVYKFD